MKVLMITGDRNFAANPRYALQAAQVDTLALVYWGPGSLWPAIPTGSYDVISAQDPFWRGLFAWYLARRFDARLNIQVHTDLSAQSFLRHVLAQIVLRHADSVRVVSEKIKKQVERMRVRAPIRVLHIFIDIERFQKIERRSHEGKVLLWIGRFEAEKDPEAALSILEQVHAAGIEARLVMLGSGTLERRLRSRAQGLPVEFPGWQDPLPYLETADVVICTSVHESYGASIIEALAAGVPVVAPDVGVARASGAFVVKHSELSAKVFEVLQMKLHCALRLELLSAEEWTKRWRQTLA